jgi:hypothetical protein
MEILRIELSAESDDLRFIELPFGGVAALAQLQHVVSPHGDNHAEIRLSAKG